MKLVFLGVSNMHTAYTTNWTSYCLLSLNIIIVYIYIYIYYKLWIVWISICSVGITYSLVALFGVGVSSTFTCGSPHQFRSKGWSCSLAPGILGWGALNLHHVQAVMCSKSITFLHRCSGCSSSQLVLVFDLINLIWLGAMLLSGFGPLIVQGVMFCTSGTWRGTV